MKGFQKQFSIQMNLRKFDNTRVQWNCGVFGREESVLISEVLVFRGCNIHENGIQSSLLIKLPSHVHV